MSAGLFGRLRRIANDLIDTSDCSIDVGCKPGEIASKRFQPFNGDAPINHLSILPEETGRTTRTDVALVGDAKPGPEDLIKALCGDSTKAMAATYSDGRRASDTVISGGSSRYEAKSCRSILPQTCDTFPRAPSRCQSVQTQACEEISGALGAKRNRDSPIRAE
ncbi:hypothetical protein [Flavimaribacter sediminis]|uniref:hypothetical protein n=1 Tax=Flavimaribacter sediminis TaxID=2865987 RepID=UPI00351F0A0A